MKKKMVGSGFGVPAIGKNYGKKATIKKNKDGTINLTKKRTKSDGKR